MNDSILQYGNNPDDIIAQMSTIPSRVLYNLQKEVAGWLRDASDSFPDYRNPELFTPFTSPYSGVGKLGYCRVDPKHPERLLRKSRICVYWPVLLKEAYDLIYTSIPLAMFLLSFKPLLQMYSSFLVEALQRNYAKCLHRRFAVSLPTLKQSPSIQQEVPGAEEVIVRELLEHLSEDEEFIRALQEMCCATYIGVTLRSERRTRLHAKEKFPLEQVRLSTLLPLVQQKKLLKTPTLPAQKWLPYELFGHAELPPMVDELLKAFHISKVWRKTEGWQKRYVDNQVNTFGVAMLPVEPGGVLFIDWERWYTYRLSAGYQSPYRNAIRANPYHKNAASLGAVSQYSPLLSDVMLSLYPDLHRRVTAYGEKTDHLKRRWGENFNDVMVSAFSIQKLLDFRSRLRKRKETVDGSDKKVTRKYTLKRLDYVFKLLVGGEEVECKAVHTGRKLWFIPPWDMSYADIIKKKDRAKGDLNNPNHLRKGVVVLKDTGETAYDVKFLANRALSPGTPPDPDVIEQLRQIARTLRRSDIKAVVAGNTTNGTKNPIHFSEYEDDFIIRNFRPNMRTETREALVEACSNRSMGAISQRATILRRRLISQGVYNLDDLPHGRYNHRIKREIDEAKQKAREKREEYD